MTPTLNTVQWTIQDLDSLEQQEWNRYEIIQGELIVTDAPHYRHQQVSFNIAQALNNWSNSEQLGEEIMSPIVIFSNVNKVVPDVVWVSKECLAKIENEAGHLCGAPELVIEILSPGTLNENRAPQSGSLWDRQGKRKLYSMYGVQEYWIGDRQLSQIAVYRRQNAELTLVATYLPEDQITSLLLPNFTAKVADFFA